MAGRRKKQVVPSKLDGRAHAAIMTPVTNALVVFRLGRAASEHYHEMLGALMIGYFVTELVPRHRPLMPEIQAGLDALNAIFRRRAQRTIDDAPFSGTPEEIDTIELAAEVYRGLVRTTPGPTLRRAILRATSAAADVPAQGDSHGSDQQDSV